jgi:hypothetical protein
MDANAMDHMSVAPGNPDDESKPAPAISADAGTDESIAKRLYANPESKEARLDRGLDESMDASDPPASTQPIHSDSKEPPESSGFDAKKEARIAAGKPPEAGLVEKMLNKIGLG